MSDYSLRELLRIAHLQASRELSDRARCEVSTFGEGHRRGGELVEDARRLVSQAEEVLRLAVAAERAAGVSWETIGEALDVTRQSAHERFAGVVEEIVDGGLFPGREGGEGRPGWWACPDGLEDPSETVERLDEWARRHRERSDPDRGQRPVSANLRTRDHRTVELIGTVTRLAQRIASGELPAGVSPAAAQRILLERKVRAFDAIAQSDTGATARDARTQADQAFAELTEWHRENLDLRLQAQPGVGNNGGVESYQFLLDGRAIAELAFTIDPGDPDATGWFTISIDSAAAEMDPDPERPWLTFGNPWPLDISGVDVDELVAVGRAQGLDAMRTGALPVVERTRSSALTRARRQLLDELAADRTKRFAAPSRGAESTTGER